MSSPGKLVRPFPGRAVEVPNSITEDVGFFAEISNLLVTMDNDVLKKSAATITKAGSEVNEDRDSAHPHLISQLFIGILRGMGKEVEPRQVVKRIADDVLWNDAHKPWRRSPVWLIVRVALQTSLSSTAEYKYFMVYFEARLLRRALEHKLFSSDLLFAMRVKVARRLYKVHASAPDFLVNFIKAVGDQTEKVLQGRWSQVQLAQGKSPDWNPAVHTFEESINQTLPNSRAYLEQVFRGRSNDNNSSSFSPIPKSRLSHVQDFAKYTDGALTSAFSSNSHVALFDFEASVHNHLSEWTTQNLGATSACDVIFSCLKQYISHSGSHYTMDVADKSIMVLTIMELWVALDRVATSQCPLLLDYSPELEDKLIESLLLRTSLHIDRAGMVQRHLRQRHANASQAGKGSVFSDDMTEDSLPIRYFRQSPSQQALKEEIEQQAQLKRDAKIEEMKRLNKERRAFSDRLSQMEHEYKASYSGYFRHDKSSCERCSVEREAAAMRIEFHEWPLPSSPVDAERVVFELQCPDAVRIWRDTTYKILSGVASLNSDDYADIHCTLSSYEGLRGSSNSPTGAITIASFTKSFTRTHYSAKLPAKQKQVCVNNGLTFKLYNTDEYTWATGPFQGTTFEKAGTLEISPNSSYRHLQDALASTSHTSNQVIGNQSDCPKELNLHEHIAFGTLRSGPRLQWMNIARGLEENILTFSRNEVYLLHTQAAWQIGSLAQDGYARDWHTELGDAVYGHFILNQSSELLGRVKANWREGISVMTVGAYF